MSWILHQFKQTAAKRAIFYGYMPSYIYNPEELALVSFHIMTTRSKQNAYRELSDINSFTSFFPHDLDSG